MGGVAPMRSFIALEIGSIAPTQTRTEVPIFNKTNEYAIAHVPKASKVHEAALRAIEETNAIRQIAGEDPLTDQEIQALLDLEQQRARDHEDANYAVRTAHEALNTARHPGPNYASEETLSKAVKNAQDRLQTAQATEIETDRAMLPDLQGH